MKYAIRAVLSCALVLGCAPEEETESLRECDSAARCWVWSPGWGSWGMSYEQAHLDHLEDTGKAVQLYPAPAGEECWRPGPTLLPLCSSEIDGLIVHGFPIEIGENLFSLEMIEGVCADTAPWESVGWLRGHCYGVTSDGVAVLLDLGRPVPAEFAPVF